MQEVGVSFDTFCLDLLLVAGLGPGGFQLRMLAKFEQVLKAVPGDAEI